MTAFHCRALALLTFFILVSAGCQNGACDDGLSACGVTCRALLSDPQNCGACGLACGEGSVCCMGGCIDPATDPDYCGAAGNCTDLDMGNRAGAMCLDVQVCAQGECRCPDGLTLCGTDCVDPLTDAEHCGACNDACNPGETCEGGGCVAETPPDAGPPDGGLPDASLPDGGLPDGGIPDGGIPDGSL